MSGRKRSLIGLGATLASHDRAISRAGTPRSICSRSSDVPARMSIGSFSCSYSYGGSRQRKRSEAARNAAMSATPVSTGRNASRSSTWIWQPPQLVCACLWNVGSMTQPDGSARPATRARSSRPRTVRRPPTAPPAARTASSSRAPRRRSCPRTAPSPGRRWRCRASGCSATAAPKGCRSRRRHVAAPALHGDDLEVRADAEGVVEEPRQLADRHAVPHRDG